MNCWCPTTSPKATAPPAPHQTQPGRTRTRHPLSQACLYLKALPLLLVQKHVMPKPTILLLMHLCLMRNPTSPVRRRCISAEGLQKPRRTKDHCHAQAAWRRELQMIKKRPVTSESLSLSFLLVLLWSLTSGNHRRGSLGEGMQTDEPLAPTSRVPSRLSTLSSPLYQWKLVHQRKSRAPPLLLLHFSLRPLSFHPLLLFFNLYIPLLNNSQLSTSRESRQRGFPPGRLWRHWSEPTGSWRSLCSPFWLAALLCPPRLMKQSREPPPSSASVLFKLVKATGKMLSPGLSYRRTSKLCLPETDMRCVCMQMFRVPTHQIGF
uniref:Uncharacterized protein n=1 Tax=Nothobranchius furzeri TaxID=105023 RepID=A0A1A8ALG2_NOTFU